MIPVGSVTQVSFLYRMCGQRLLNVTHWVNNTLINEDTAVYTQKVADAFGSATNPTSPANLLAEILPSNCVIESVRAQVIRDLRYAYAEKLVSLAGALGVSDTANIDVVATKRTRESGRSQVGAFHLPGIDPAKMADGLVSGAFRADVLANLDWLTEPFEWLSGQPALYPIILHPLGQDPPWNGVYDLTIQPEVRVMHRRTVGRGI